MQVELYPNRLVVKSPGGLYGGVDVTQLGTEDVSSSRNAVLAKLLAEVPFDRTAQVVCENRGSGLHRVMIALREAGMSPPDFDASPAHLFVTVPQHALLDPPTVEWIGSLRLPGLTNAQHLALAMLRSGGSVSNAMLRVWGIDAHAATHALSDLVQRGVVVRHGGRRYATYELDDDVRCAHHHNDVVIESTGESRERRIATELQSVLAAIRAGHTSSRAIAEQLGLSYQTALRRIRVLRDAGVIEETAARHSRTQRYRILQDTEISAGVRS